MTALAFIGIAIFAVAVIVVGIAMTRDAVHYVRDVRSMVRAGTELNVRDEPLEDVLSLGNEPSPDIDPRPSKSEDDVPPGWGFR
jgi:hypothetical protein